MLLREYVLAVAVDIGLALWLCVPGARSMKKRISAELGIPVTSNSGSLVRAREVFRSFSSSTWPVRNAWRRLGSQRTCRLRIVHPAGVGRRVKFLRHIASCGFVQEPIRNKAQIRSVCDEHIRDEDEHPPENACKLYLPHEARTNHRRPDTRQIETMGCWHYHVRS